MDTDLSDGYERQLEKFNRLLSNLEDAISLFLQEKEIPSLAVYGRVKTLEYFQEKVERKGYTDPFVQTEDLVGIRIIVYFPKDLERVVDALESEFTVLEHLDKSASLGPNEFGYRSIHNLIKIREEWCSTPNYRGLQDLKAEVQIRTVLMHAWAEVEHKLKYKNKSQVPTALQRRLFLLSAKFEEADQQFQDLKEGVESYKAEIAERVKKAGEFEATLELNLNTFNEFLAFFYPKLDRSDHQVSELFKDIQNENFDFKALVKFAEEGRKLESIILKAMPKTTRENVFRYTLETLCPSINWPASGGRKKFTAKLKDYVKLA